MDRTAEIWGRGFISRGERGLVWIRCVKRRSDCSTSTKAMCSLTKQEKSTLVVNSHLLKYILGQTCRSQSYEENMSCTIKHLMPHNQTNRDKTPLQQNYLSGGHAGTKIQGPLLWCESPSCHYFCADTKSGR